MANTSTAGYVGPAAMTNSAGLMAGTPPPITAPQYVPFQGPTVPTIPGAGSGVPGTGSFTGKAPTATPYGDFTAPDPTTFTHSPDYQYNVDQQQRALQHSAAAHGTLLSGATQKSLQANASGLAAGDYQNAFTRALQGYTANRDTNAQNFGQQMGTFQGNLGAFTANANANNDAAKNAFGTYDRQYGAARDMYGDASGAASAQNTVQNVNNQTGYQAAQDQFAAQIAAQRAQNDAVSAGIRSAAPVSRALPGAPVSRSVRR